MILPKSRDRRRISDILTELADGDENGVITINDIRLALGDRAFGALMLVFAAPNLVPVFIPGLSSVLAIPLVLLAAQLMLGYRHPWFPARLNARAFVRADFARAIRRIVPWLIRTEKLLQPRLLICVDDPFDRVIGLCCLILAVMLALPIPLGNWLPALSICMFSMALTERDGMASLIGMIIGVLAVTVASTVLYTLLRGILLALGII